MIVDTLQKELSGLLADKPDTWSEALAILRKFKADGGTQKDALTTLENLRADAPTEEAEDHILELMDVASGWCHPNNRIW